MVDVSFSLQLESLRRMYVGTNLIVLRIQTCLVVVFTSGSVGQHRACSCRPASESAIEGGNVLLRECPYITCIESIGVFWGCWRLLHFRACCRSYSTGEPSHWLMKSTTSAPHEPCSSHISLLVPSSRQQHRVISCGSRLLCCLVEFVRRADTIGGGCFLDSGGHDQPPVLFVP